MSIMKALKLGLESRTEEAVFYMDDKLSGQEFIVRLNAKLPDGIKIINVIGDDLNA
jgi:uncharacterized protein (DUF2344 family)